MKSTSLISPHFRETIITLVRAYASTHILVYLVALFLLSSCSKPTPPPSPLTGPDTTSHDFTFRKDTLGDGNSSMLNDVWIFDENNVWAVGEMYVKDSSGKWDPTAYNVAKWDGHSWILQRISVMYKSHLITPPLDAIFALSENNIWVLSGVPIYWNGRKWRQFHLYDMGVLTYRDGDINKIWGQSDCMYFVGINGTIVRYNGEWRKLDSGTDLDFQDIWGDRNPETGEWEILAVASNFLAGRDRYIVSIKNDNVIAVSDLGISYQLKTIWFRAGKQYFAGGEGIYHTSSISQDLFWKGSLGIYMHAYTFSLRGNDVNDIIFVGGLGNVVHYNGSTWKDLSYYTRLGFGNYHSVAMKGNTFYAVGQEGSRAVILRGKR